MRAEWETIINFCANDRMASVYSNDPAWVKKIKDYANKNGSEINKVGDGYELIVEKKYIKLQNQIKLTKDQKAARIKILKKINKQK